MYTKQDSIFWWNLEQYLGKTTFDKEVSLNKKIYIENSFRLAYYGLMQYQLYKGRQLHTIELANMDQILEYINNNYEILSVTFTKQKEKKWVSSKSAIKEKQAFLDLLEKFVLPYINDHSFEDVNKFRITKENLLTFLMQLTIKNQFDINIVDENEMHPETPYYSQVYPFMITLLIIDPTNPNKIYERVKQFYNPEILEERYHNGRSLSEEEINVLAAQIDLLDNLEDFNYFLLNFGEEKWLKSDLQTRFKLVYQLAKLTSILLKENIYNLTYLENEAELYDLVETYLPIILRNEEEILAYKNDSDEYYFEKKQHPPLPFLLPWSVKDFDPEIIEHYYQKLKVYEQQFDLDRLYKFMDVSLYSSTYMRLINLLGKDSPLFMKFFIDQKELALVNTLKIFKLVDDHYKQMEDYEFRLNEVFLDSTTLKKLETFKLNSSIKKLSPVLEEYKSILMFFSFMLALCPTRVKEFGYSLDELVKYYVILYGPYKKTKIGYQTQDYFLLTKRIIELVMLFKEKYVLLETNETELIQAGYYLHIYLIEKLLEFSKNEN